MGTNLNAAVLSFLAAAMLLAAASACSDDSRDPDAAARTNVKPAQDDGQDAQDPSAANANAGDPQSSASAPADPIAAQTESVDILQSDNRFITIALSRYRSSVRDIDPSALNP